MFGENFPHGMLLQPVVRRHRKWRSAVSPLFKGRTRSENSAVGSQKGACRKHLPTHMTGMQGGTQYLAVIVKLRFPDNHHADDKRPSRPFDLFMQSPLCTDLWSILGILGIGSCYDPPAFEERAGACIEDVSSTTHEKATVIGCFRFADAHCFPVQIVADVLKAPPMFPPIDRPAGIKVAFKLCQAHFQSGTEFATLLGRESLKKAHFIFLQPGDSRAAVFLQQKKENVNLCWEAWNRTKIHGFKGRCPTIRRPPNENKRPV